MSTISRPLKIKEMVKMGKDLVVLDEEGNLWLSAHFEVTVNQAFLDDARLKTPKNERGPLPLNWTRLCNPEKIL